MLTPEKNRFTLDKDKFFDYIELGHSETFEIKKGPFGGQKLNVFSKKVSATAVEY